MQSKYEIKTCLSENIKLYFTNIVHTKNEINTKPNGGYARPAKRHQDRNNSDIRRFDILH